MKRTAVLSLIAAGLLLGGLMLPRAANAACALPHGLANDTTADAAQVMANYKALQDCIVALQTAAATLQTRALAANGEGTPGAPVLLSVEDMRWGAVGKGGTSYYWFATSDPSVHAINLLNLASDLKWELYSQPDFSTGLLTSCDNSLGAAGGEICATSALLAGTSYYLKVVEKSGSTAGEYVLGVGLPVDLTVTVNTVSYTAGNLNFGFTVNNPGNADFSGDLKVYFYDDRLTAPTGNDPPFSVATYPDISIISASSIVLNHTTKPTALGSGTAWVLVDAENQIPETNKSNNTGSKTW